MLLRIAITPVLFSVTLNRATKLNSYWGPRSKMESILASHSVALGLILEVPKNFSLDVVEIY